MRKHILYLASGSGRRFGSNKLLYSLQGKPMFLHGLETLQKVISTRADCDLLVISRYEAIRQAARQQNIQAVDSPDSQLGICHTIRAGISALGTVPEEDYLLFVVADQPYLTAASVLRLLETADGQTECACLCYGQQPGNPCLFSACLVPELLALEGDTGGRAVLKRHACVLVPADSPKELEDIDILP